MTESFATFAIGFFVGSLTFLGLNYAFDPFDLDDKSTVNPCPINICIMCECEYVNSCNCTHSE